MSIRVQQIASGLAILWFGLTAGSLISESLNLAVPGSVTGCLLVLAFLALELSDGNRRRREATPITPTPGPFQGEPGLPDFVFGPA
jgi:putative effector of murein hydrolase LrgA (UPF0299 family)